jgi:predicted ATPase
MAESIPVTSHDSFGALLRHLRRRARLTQRELGIAVGYSEAHIARLESGQRSPDPAVVSGQFVGALGLPGEPDLATQLVALAEAARESSRAGNSAPGEPAGPHTNLRVQLTSFVGRETEVADVKRLLSATRLLTITGPGGVGKTRLAVRVASDVLPTFDHGVFIVPLAAVRDGAKVPGLVALAMGLLSDDATAESLRDQLQDKHIMIVLDTCEHLIDACAALAVRLVQGCPQLTLLATSREALNVPGEVTWQMPPMSCDEAMQLFIERAKAVRQDFLMGPGDDALLVQICQQLDGLPLAIELAASRLRVLSLAQIAARLDDRFGLLTGNNRLAPLKQQTLRTMIDWSYDLLSEPERMLLRRLSIFTTDFTLDLAEAVCADTSEPARHEDGLIQRGEVLDLLVQLVNKSLVVVDERAAPHYSLSNTIRQYAHEKLVEAGEFDDVYRRYLQYLPFTTQTAQTSTDPTPITPIKTKRVKTPHANKRRARVKTK